mgnify:CR=1 FL=1
MGSNLQGKFLFSRKFDKEFTIITRNFKVDMCDFLKWSFRLSSGFQYCSDPAKLKSNLSDDANWNVFFCNNHDIQSLYRLKSKFIFPATTLEFMPLKSCLFNSTSDLVLVNAHTAKNDDSCLIDYLVCPLRHITLIRSIIFATAAKILSKLSSTEMFACGTSYNEFTKLLFL